MGLNVLAGIRYDTIDMNSKQPFDKLLFASSNNVCLPATAADYEAECGNALSADDEEDGISWTLSVSWDLPIGIRPYITASEQSTLIAGQGAELVTNNIAEGTIFDTSELFEVGVKGSLLDDKLYFALSFYEQERTDLSTQSIVTNQTTETEGMEFEMRWAVTDRLLMTAGWSKIEVTNLSSKADGFRFSFIGAEDLPNIDPTLLFGGQVGGLVASNPRRAGMPENIFSLTATYEFTDNLAGHMSVVHAEEVDSGYSGTIVLPDYTLVNMGVQYQTQQWLFNVNVKNLTDEEYFRSNFPNLFGSTIVLPELPRHFAATVQYSF